MDDYRVRHHQRLDAIHQGLVDNPAMIVALSNDIGAKVLRYLLALSCESQNVTNIELGRETVAALPGPWLVERIHALAERRLDLANEWECRRLLELYAVLDNQLAAEFAASSRQLQTNALPPSATTTCSDPRNPLSRTSPSSNYTPRRRLTLVAFSGTTKPNF